MSDYLTLAQARAELGVSPFVFNQRFRPQLTEISRGPRTVLFPAVEVAQIKGESDGMWNKKKVSDALDHAWAVRWKEARGSHKKESLKDKVAEEIGTVALRDLDFNRIEEWVQDLRDADKSADTIKSRLSCLRMALKLAAQKGWIKAVPPFPEVERGRTKIRYLLDDPDEEAKLMDACGCLNHEQRVVMQLAIVFMLDTGCRLSELLKTRWRHVKEKRVIFEDRKAGDTHGVPLTPRAKQAITDLLDNDYWLARVRGADKSETRCRSAQNWMTHRFTEIRDHAKLPDVTLHTLRHTCASRLVQAGVSLYDVSKFLGHSSITVTERYAHLAPDTLEGAVTVLSNRSLPNKVVKMR